MRTRQLWLDLARGIAVVSMVIAHTAPAGGVFNVTEYLTAPLFAAAIGAGIELAWRTWDEGAGRFVGAYAVRGAILFLVGVLLVPVYTQVVVVLQWLGILTVIVAALVAFGVRGWGALASASALVVAAFPLMVATRGPWAPPGALAPTVEFLISGGPYRLLPLTAAALVGVGLMRWLGREALAPRTSMQLAVVAALAAAGAVIVGKLTSLGADPYSGTYPEMVAAIGVTVAVLAGSRWASEGRSDTVVRRLDPVVATGRLAMTAYVLQSVVLRILTDTFLGGSRDDHWWVLSTTLLILVGFSWAWRRFVGQGPFEWLLRLHLPLFRRAARPSS